MLDVFLLIDEAWLRVEIASASRPAQVLVVCLNASGREPSPSQRVAFATQALRVASSPEVTLPTKKTPNWWYQGPTGSDA